MSTKNIVPRNNNEGQIGTSAKIWATGHFGNIFSNGVQVSPVTFPITGANFLECATASVVIVESNYGQTIIGEDSNSHPYLQANNANTTIGFDSNTFPLIVGPPNAGYIGFNVFGYPILSSSNAAGFGFDTFNHPAIFNQNGGTVFSIDANGNSQLQSSSSQVGFGFDTNTNSVINNSNGFAIFSQNSQLNAVIQSYNNSSALIGFDSNGNPILSLNGSAPTNAYFGFNIDPLMVASAGGSIGFNGGNPSFGNSNNHVIFSVDSNGNPSLVSDNQGSNYSFDSGGDLSLNASSGARITASYIRLNAANVVLEGSIPTSNPHVAGQLYQIAGALMISTG